MKKDVAVKSIKKFTNFLKKWKSGKITTTHLCEETARLDLGFSRAESQEIANKLGIPRDMLFYSPSTTKKEKVADN